MPRIPYVTDEQAGDTPLVAAIRKRRGGGLLKLDRQLLHSAPFAEGWNGLLGAVRTRLAVDAKLRELAMCVVAVLNRAEYEVALHVPEFRKVGGTQVQVDAVKGADGKQPDPSLFDELENATIALAFQMTRNVEVDESTFTTLRKHLGATEVVELVGIVAAFNMVTRFLVALQVEPE